MRELGVYINEGVIGSDRASNIRLNLSALRVCLNRFLSLPFHPPLLLNGMLPKLDQLLLYCIYVWVGGQVSNSNPLDV